MQRYSSPELQRAAVAAVAYRLRTDPRGSRRQHCARLATRLSRPFGCVGFFGASIYISPPSRRNISRRTRLRYFVRPPEGGAGPNTLLTGSLARLRAAYGRIDANRRIARRQKLMRCGCTRFLSRSCHLYQEQGQPSQGGQPLHRRSGAVALLHSRKTSTTMLLALHG